jgi:hypothetical protein
MNIRNASDPVPSSSESFFLKQVSLGIRYPGIQLSLVTLKITARTGFSGFICPSRPGVFLLNAYQSGRWLVGAVGIENNADRNRKDLGEMLRSAKALKRNNWESKGSLIGPSMAPHLSGCSDSVAVFPLNVRKPLSASAQIFAARMASR